MSILAFPGLMVCYLKDMKIAFKDFRAFQETRLIDVRPLTFLVGENSSGKTSFLAALNYMWGLRERLGTPSFNIPPFDLGTFDEIVHRVRGRAKPNCFEIIAEDVIIVDRKQSSFFYRAKFPENRLTDKARMKVTFVDNVGDAIISKVCLEYAARFLIISADNRLRVQVESSDGKAIFDTQDGQKNLEFEETIARIEKISVSELIFVLRRIIIENEDDKSDDVIGSLALMSAALEQFLRTFPNATFASAPVRSNPNRVYTPTDQSRTPEGTHTPQRLFKIKESNQAHWERVKSRLEAFGKMSGMFSAINVARYRSSGSSPFNINVTRKGKQSNIVDVGYGVSQALPILTDLIESPPASGFLFQQPEVHLQVV